MINNLDSELIAKKADMYKEKLNEITSKLGESIDLSDEIIQDGSELEENIEKSLIQKDEYYQSKLTDSLFDANILDTQHAIDLETLLTDFKYVRGVLKDNAEYGRKILKKISEEIIIEDSVVEFSETIRSFSDLNKSITDNMDLYLKTYKEISTIIVQLDKINQKSNNNIKSEMKDVNDINTKDIIQKLNKAKEL